MNRQLHLNLFIHSRGHHEASWRHRGSSPLPLTDIRYYQDLAQRAETALFDSLFLADQLALGGDVAQAPRTWLEPITVLAAVAAATQPHTAARKAGVLDSRKPLRERDGLSAGGNRIRTIGPASGKVVDAKFQRSDPGRSNTNFGRRC